MDPSAIGEESDTLFLAPTNGHIAHANERREPAVDSNDTCLAGHPELGISLYDTHRDGMRCMYSSRLRPTLNLRPGSGQLDADLKLIGLLERTGIGYSVATDEDVDREDAAVLRPHRVVSTGAQPGFCTPAMLEARGSYTSEGDRGDLPGPRPEVDVGISGAEGDWSWIDSGRVVKPAARLA